MLKMEVQRRDGIFNIMGYSDTDYAGDKDTHRSVSGIIIYLCGISIAWKSKGQKAVTLSSTKSEYYALSELCSQIIFEKENSGIYMRVEIEYPIIIKVHNIGDIFFLANNPVLSQRTMHILTRLHSIREFVENGIITIIFVKIEVQRCRYFDEKIETIFDGEDRDVGQ